MPLWDRWQQQRQWRAEFKDVPTHGLRRMAGNSAYAPDKQRFVEGLLRRREQQPLLNRIGTVIGIIVGSITIISVVIAVFAKFLGAF